MIPQETVNKILDAAQIEDVVGDFVSLKRRGANLIACCPFHNEKTPSFYVSPAKGIFKCFGCGKSGSAVGFVMEHESMSYVEALKYLARKYHIEVVEKEETAEEIAKRQRSESLHIVLDYAAKFFQSQLSSDMGRALGYAYFKSRGLDDATIEKFGLGWSPAGKGLVKAAVKDGYKEEFLVDAGLAIKKEDGNLVDRFYERAMFPIHSVSGRVIAFGGRTLKSDKTIAKYVNSPETEIYIKNKSLYGIYFAKNEMSRKDMCYLVEGYLDVISLHQLGITNVVASSGTSLTVGQIRLIRKFTENITVIYDGDSAGIHAALRGIGLILNEGLNVKVVLLPEGEDPDSFARKHSCDEVEDYILNNSQDFISFKSRLLLDAAGQDPLKKANLINDVADTIALIPDAIKRAVYVEMSCRDFGVDEGILYARINQTRSKNLIAEQKAAEKQQEKQYEQQQEQVPPALEYLPEEEETVPQSVEPRQNVGFEDAFLAPCERDLLDFILSNGQSELIFDVDSEHYHPNEPPPTVADFIDNSLAADNLEFTNSRYRKVYDLYFGMYDEGYSQDEIIRAMFDGADREIADTVSNIVVEKHVITVQNYIDSMTSEQTRLVMFVPKAILSYQSRIVTRQIENLSKRLNALTDGDVEQISGLLKEINELNSLKKALTEKMGRV